MLQNPKTCVFRTESKPKTDMASDILTSTFMRLRERLRANARRMLADDIEADDALQDAFCRLWKHRERIVTDSQAEGLSVIAVRNTCIDTLRRRQNNLPVDQAEAELSDSDDGDSLRDELYRSVKEIIDSRLSERERRVITMRDTMGMDFADIADELGITENNTRMILSRARRTVREIYLSDKRNRK